MSRRVWFAVAIAAFALQGLFFWLEVRPAARAYWGDEITYSEAAAGFARGERPELALWPSLYPRLLSFLVAEDGRPWLAIPFQIGLLVLAAWALARFGEEALGDRRAAHLAAALLLLNPGVAAFTHYLWPEILHLCCFMTALALIAAGRAVRFGRAFAAGALIGVALLAKSLLAPFLIVLAVLLWRIRIPGPAMAGLGLGLVVVVTSWASWERSSTGELRLTKSAWFNVWVGLNDRSPRNLVDEIVGDEAGAYIASAATSAEREAIVRGKTLAFLRERGIGRVLIDQLGRQYFRLFDAHSFFSDQLPGGAIAIRGYGYRMTSEASATWATLLRTASRIFYGALLVAAVWGLWATPWSARPWSGVIAAFLLYNLGLFLVLHVKSRYRVQFEPFLCLLAAQAWVHRDGLRERVLRTPVVAALAIGLSGLLLFLAFQ